MDKVLPLVLVLDDLFGRDVADGRNVDRENLCAQFLWRDITGDAASLASTQAVLVPVAEVIFHRAQIPLRAAVGDIVENDVASALARIREFWWPSAASPRLPSAHSRRRLSMVLLDLCFYTGKVTDESHRTAPGMPEGRPRDSGPKTYFGLKLLAETHREFPDLPVFVLSSMPRKSVALELSRRGALGFIDRTAQDGPAQFAQALSYHGLLSDPAGVIVGQSLPLLLALREARRAAQHRLDVLIRGERGTGKELFAQFIHRMSAGSRGGRAGPLVAINTPVLTPSLFASELYGIEPGSATGVVGRRGLIETANGGDVFLDEIAEMAPEVQASLLRVVQEREVTPVGARRPRPVDIRVIGATNADIDNPQSGFRPDLLDRLKAGGSIWLPPLRERLEDIPLLVEQFVREAESRRASTLRREISQDAIDKLLAHHWPGNVRELQAVVSDAVNRFADVEHLVADHLRIATEGRSTRVAAPGRSVRFQPATPASVETQSQCSLETVLQQAASLSFRTDNLDEWAGQLGTAQAHVSEMFARMVQAALDATRRRTPAHPSGVIQIHPAVKLLTGDSSVSASKAADMMKRLLGPMSDRLEGDLRQAYETSIRLRPKRRKPESAS
jgi:DNA-binding NtrC family response regulator